MCKCNQKACFPCCVQRAVDGAARDEATRQPVPHKHAALIKAWADGAIIEARYAANGNWLLATTPIWSDDYEYRIKPVKKTIGELMYNSWYSGQCWERCAIKGEWENAASKFLAAVKEQENA